MQAASTWRIICGAIVIGLVGCSGVDVEVPEGYRTENNERIRDQYGTVWGDGGPLFQRGTGRFARQDGTDGGGFAGIGVNAYLWRAALETIDFLPLAQADPFDFEADTAPRRPLRQHGHVAAVGVDVQVVGIEVPDDDLHAAASQ